MIAALYQSIHNFVIKSPRYAELTVEDPSEDFEDLRDKADLRMLLAHKEFIREAYGASDGKLAKLKDSNGKAKEHLGENKTQGKSGTKSSGVAMLGPPTKPKWAERWRKELKFAKVGLRNFLYLMAWLNMEQRQYERLIEMLILRALDPNDEAMQRAFRLQVKARIKAFNFVRLFLAVQYKIDRLASRKPSCN